MTDKKFDPNSSTVVQRAIQLHAVPKERWQTMVGRTIIGTIFVALGLAGFVVLDLNVYVSIGLIVFGATTWSNQIITGSLMALIRPVKAYKRIKDGDA